MSVGQILGFASAGLFGVSALVLAFAAIRARGREAEAIAALNVEADKRRDLEAQLVDAHSITETAIAERDAAVRGAAATRATLDDERRQRATEYEELAKAGAPGGAVAVDHSIDRLYPDAHDYDDGTHTDPGRGRPVPDPAASATGKPTTPR